MGHWASPERDVVTVNHRPRPHPPCEFAKNFSRWRRWAFVFWSLLPHAHDARVPWWHARGAAPLFSVFFLSRPRECGVTGRLTYATSTDLHWCARSLFGLAGRYKLFRHLFS